MHPVWKYEKTPDFFSFELNPLVRLLPNVLILAKCDVADALVPDIPYAPPLWRTSKSEGIVSVINHTVVDVTYTALPR